MKLIYLTDGLSDLFRAVDRYSLIAMLGWQDVRQRYRRSALGPFWLSISMGVTICTIGVVFGKIFNTPMVEFLPFLSIGMIMWTYISTVLTESCTSFIASEGIIKQLPLPFFVHTLRTVWRNTLILFHNIVLLPIVFLVVSKSITPVAFLAIPGIILAVLNLIWVSLVLGILCARYRDMPQIVTSIIQVVFYLTPVMWMPSSLPVNMGKYILQWNPLFHMMEIIRSPLLGQVPSTVNWMVSLFIAIIGWVCALIILSRYKNRIAYWL